MKKVLGFFKKEMMLTLSLIAAAAALIITPPSERLIRDIDWRTLGTLLMMLCVLEGFKKENIFRPLIRLAGRMKRMTGLTLFLVFGVFFTSMFVTNDVSLIIFVPLTILLFRAAGTEKPAPGKGRPGFSFRSRRPPRGFRRGRRGHQPPQFRRKPGAHYSGEPLSLSVLLQLFQVCRPGG